jgi:hypothetical protein
MGINFIPSKYLSVKPVKSETTTSTSFSEVLNINGQGRIVYVGQINNAYDSFLKITIDDIVIFSGENLAVVVQYPILITQNFTSTPLICDLHFRKSCLIEHRSAVNTTTTTTYVLYELE